MRALSAACDADGSAEAVRDRALLWFGFASGGRRRSEIASALFADLRRDGDDYYFLLRTSKTNKTGELEVKPVFGLAAYHLTQWLELRGNWAGPLFCRLARDGVVRREGNAMSTEMIRLVIRKWAARAGVTRRLSAHSLRSGFLTQAGIDKVPTAEAMKLSGHRTYQMVAQYYRVGELRHSPGSHLAGVHPDKAKRPR
jgi:integrase